MVRRVGTYITHVCATLPNRFCVGKRSESSFSSEEEMMRTSTAASLLTLIKPNQPMTRATIKVHYFFFFKVPHFRS